MKLGMQLGLGPGHIVLDGDTVPSPPRGLPRVLCVRWEPSPPKFSPMFIIFIVISLEHCTKHSHYWFVQVQVQVLYSVHSIFRKFNRTYAVCSN